MLCDLTAAALSKAKAAINMTLLGASKRGIIKSAQRALMMTKLTCSVKFERYLMLHWGVIIHVRDVADGDDKERRDYCLTICLAMCLCMHTLSQTYCQIFLVISSIEHYTTQHYTIQQLMTECCTIFNFQSIGMRCSDRGSVRRFKGETRTVRTAWQGVQEGMHPGHEHFIAWRRPHLQ